MNKILTGNKSFKEVINDPSVASKDINGKFILENNCNIYIIADKDATHADVILDDRTGTVIWRGLIDIELEVTETKIPAIIIVDGCAVYCDNSVELKITKYTMDEWEDHKLSYYDVLLYTVSWPMLKTIINKPSLKYVNPIFLNDYESPRIDHLNANQCINNGIIRYAASKLEKRLPSMIKTKYNLPTICCPEAYLNMYLNEYLDVLYNEDAESSGDLPAFYKFISDKLNNPPIYLMAAVSMISDDYNAGDIIQHKNNRKTIKIPMSHTVIKYDIEYYAKELSCILNYIAREHDMYLGKEVYNYMLNPIKEIGLEEINHTNIATFHVAPVHAFLPKDRHNYFREG